jgi:ArsR family transcriptional regulator, arsenate/arsenite/antimonite-responsive transcriptional repressor
MELIQIYQCFCDQTRLRILHLLAQAPLCVCHFQEILGEPQVKISKHLSYLRTREMVVAEREKNWMMYSLPKKRAPAFEMNLKCLQDCVQSDPVFKRDLKAMANLQAKCCKPARMFLTPKRRGPPARSSPKNTTVFR